MKQSGKVLCPLSFFCHFTNFISFFGRKTTNSLYSRNNKSKGGIFIMFGIGIPELLLILVIGLIFFGPGKLPEIGTALGKSMREFRQAVNGEKNENSPKSETSETRVTDPGK